jgi:putative tricarboxylic transport membrane protein
MRTANLVAALLTVALGLFMVAEAGKMNTGFTAGLHAGIFPRLLGLGLALLGSFQLVQQLRPAADHTRISWPNGRYRWQLLVISSAVIGYLVAIPLLGFALTTLLFSLIVIRVLGDYRWPTIAGAAFLTAGISTVVFQVWLDLKLPGGWLGY